MATKNTNTKRDTNTSTKGSTKGSTKRNNEANAESMARAVLSAQATAAGNIINTFEKARAAAGETMAEGLEKVCLALIAGGPLVTAAFAPNLKTSDPSLAAQRKKEFAETLGNLIAATVPKEASRRNYLTWIGDRVRGDVPVFTFGGKALHKARVAAEQNESADTDDEESAGKPKAASSRTVKGRFVKMLTAAHDLAEKHGGTIGEGKIDPLDAKTIAAILKKYI